MTEVISVKSVDSPPSDEDHILVSPAPSGAYDISGSIQESDECATFIVGRVVAQSREEAIKRAVAEAEQRGIEKVYVAGGDGA